jgi:predicted RNA binding protein YcfA (HicA-like mRNA interferase family)
MPRKIRQLKAMLRKAGFRSRPGKGSHTVWEHPRASRPVTLAGKDGSDAKPYQEKEVEERIEEAEDRS